MYPPLGSGIRLRLFGEEAAKIIPSYAQILVGAVHGLAGRTQVLQPVAAPEAPALPHRGALESNEAAVARSAPRRLDAPIKVGYHCALAPVYFSERHCSAGLPDQDRDYYP